MTDLVELLRDPGSCKSWEHADRQRERAADEIERLDAALEAAQQLAMSRGDELNAKDEEINGLRAECALWKNRVGDFGWDYCGELQAARAECDALRKDAERWRYVNTHSEWRRNDNHDGRYGAMMVRLPYEADLSCKAMRENTIDAAIDAARSTK
jgi:hypothetical protein